MPIKDMKKQRLTAYTPAYIKQALTAYVLLHPEVTASKFIRDAINEKLVIVGAIDKRMLRVKRKKKVVVVKKTTTKKE